MGEVGSRIFAVNFDFLGLVDLARIPTLKFWTVAGGFALFLLPVVSAGSSLVFSFISMKTNAVNQQAAQAGNNASMKSMMIISPDFPVDRLLHARRPVPVLDCPEPAEHGAGVHLRQAAQKDYEKAAAARAEQERLEKEEEKEERRRKAEERARRIEEAKLNKGKKKKTEKKHDEDEDKIPGSVKEHSRVGLRQYARGRAYDPYRYSEEGPTAYPERPPSSRPDLTPAR